MTPPVKTGTRAFGTCTLSVTWQGVIAQHAELVSVVSNPTGSTRNYAAFLLALYQDDLVQAGAGTLAAWNQLPASGWPQINSGSWTGPADYTPRRRLYPVLDGINPDNNAAGDVLPIYTPDAWNPGLKPAGTVIASGTANMGVSTPALVDFVVKTTATRTSIWGTVDARSMPLLEVTFTRLDANTLIGATPIDMDLLDDEGNWWRVASFNAAGTLALGAPQLTGLKPYATLLDGKTLALNPTKVSFRKHSDAVGSATLAGPTDILYLDPLATDIPAVPLEVRVVTDLSLDAYKPGTQQVTGTTPAVSDGTHTVVIVPNPDGSITVKTPDGTTVGTTGPLPGGPVNGPITVRIDGDTMFIIYDGAVIWLWKLSTVAWWNLNLSTLYVGLWDPTSHVVTPSTPVYPPLGGWKYRLFAEEKVPGISPRLFRAWAHFRQGVTVVVDAQGAYFTSGGWDSSLATDPTVTVFPGGQEWELDAVDATKVAAAGGLEWLTEIVP